MSVSNKKAEVGKSPAHERLRRLLLLVPFVSQQQGISVDELAEKLGLSRDDLLEDLDLLTMVGRPPFQPDDFIDVYVENDEVYVDLDQRLNVPPRLTAAEAAALASAAELLKPAAGEALSNALKKLERVVPASARQRFKDMGRMLNLALDGPVGMAPLAKAIAEHKEVEFEYVSVGKGQSERRVVRPMELFSHRGQWYLSAHCCVRQDERLFRLDRIGVIDVTSRVFEPMERRRPLFSDSVSEEVVVRFSKQAALYQRERFNDVGTVLPDGSFEVKVPGDSERWLTQWVLSFGGDAEVIHPESARKAVELAARRLVSSRTT